MLSNRAQRTADWFFKTVFREETIRPRATVSCRLPAPLRAARSLEAGGRSAGQSRESIFLKQATLLANYTDDFPFQKPVQRYFPTYQSLSDEELRGYFTWRTKLRRGQWEATSLSFAFLYIYELLAGIGVADPEAGWMQLQALREHYGPLDTKILPYLDVWMTDYVVYHAMDAQLLAHTPQARLDHALWVFSHMERWPDEVLMEAVKALAPQWLERSRFYAQHGPLLERVICRVLRSMAQHYETHCQHTLTEHLFGPYREFPYTMFQSAVFLDRQTDRVFEYTATDLRVYYCNHGLWRVQRYAAVESGRKRLNDLLKTIDAILRERCQDPHPISPVVTTKWQLTLMQKEAAACTAQEAAKPAAVVIDTSRLEQIRRDAAATRDKLLVEEELFLPEDLPPLPSDGTLSPEEYRYLQCLLYHRPLDWLRSAGCMPAVLADSINEKLYDTFQDTVLADETTLLEDYIDQLKERILP